MNNSLKNFAWFFVGLILIINGCNNDPTSVGSNLLQDANKIKLYEYNTQLENSSQKSSTFHQNVLLGISDKLILGKNSYSESYILFRFNVYLADSLINKIKDNKLQIAETWMDMKVKYSLGEKSLPFDFSVHQIRKTWSSEHFNIDSLTVLNYDANDISFSRSINDTLVKFNLQPNSVFEWLKYSVDTLSAPKNNGILLKPSFSTQRFLGFEGIQLSNNADAPTLYIVLEQPSVFKDTIAVSPYMDIHAVKGQEINTISDIVLQGGFAHRGFLFFDLSSLPKGIIVSKAILELSVDSINTVDGVPASDSILVKILNDSTKKTYTADSSIYTILSRSGNLYSGDISWIVQKWISGSNENKGIELSLTDEKSSVARIWLYGSKETNTSLRPRLKIYYLQNK